ncbi:MAG: ribonuclease HII [Gemmatimonadota bacterium]
MELAERLPGMTVEEVRRYLSRRRRIGGKTVTALLSDRRRAVRLLGEVCRTRLRSQARERRRLARLGEIERQLYETGVERVVGVDEAGVSPFAGPVVAAAVVLPREARIAALDDSKRLDEPTRDRLFDEIRARAVDWAVGIASPRAIDTFNIYRAAVAAMRLAIGGLEAATRTGLERPEPGEDGPAGAPPRPALLLDGRRIRNFPYAHRAIVHGDARCRSIAAASILAKVTRDRLMRSLHEIHPDYNFSSNKGYGTSEHLDGIRRHGLCAYHRRTFAPVWDLGESGSPEFRLWQEEILHCEDGERLREIDDTLQPLQPAFLPQEFRTLTRLLRLAQGRLRG